MSTSFEEIFSNVDLLIMFKNFMKERHDADTVPAVVWIKRMEDMSPRIRRKQKARFAAEYIGDGAPRQLNIDAATVELFDKPDLSDADLKAILEDLEQALTDGWFQFNTSLSPKLRRMASVGQFTPPSERRRARFRLNGSRNSDDMIRDLLAKG